jgi:cytoskeletal protein RodZ
MPALGERFRAAREARGLSLSDVAEQIRIRSVYLAAIEDENWSTIGAPVYIRGFLRTYGRFLGLDTEEIVSEFNGASPEPAASSPGSSQKNTYLAEPPPPRHLSPLLWIASVIAVALIAYVFYSALTLHRHPDQTVAALPSNTPAEAAQATASDAAAATPAADSPSQGPADGSASPGASPTAGAGPSLDVRLSSSSWVRVTVDGNVSMEGTFPAGTERLFHGKTAVLRIGNAGGVEVLIDGKSVGPLGKAGDVVERTFTL